MLVLYLFDSGNRVANDDSDSGMEDERSNVALLKLDEWLHFKLDSEVSNVQRSSEYFRRWSCDWVMKHSPFRCGSNAILQKSSEQFLDNMEVKFWSSKIYCHLSYYA